MVAGIAQTATLVHSLLYVYPFYIKNFNSMEDNFTITGIQESAQSTVGYYNQTSDLATYN